MYKFKTTRKNISGGAAQQDNDLWDDPQLLDQTVSDIDFVDMMHFDLDIDEPPSWDQIVAWYEFQNQILLGTFQPGSHISDKIIAVLIDYPDIFNNENVPPALVAKYVKGRVQIARQAGYNYGQEYHPENIQIINYNPMPGGVDVSDYDDLMSISRELGEIVRYEHDPDLLDRINPDRHSRVHRGNRTSSRRKRKPKSRRKRKPKSRAKPRKKSRAKPRKKSRAKRRKTPP
tara:strand:- start:470 stop:1162 length:693 start_codon:yes stop_codon:yes gene_type:complete